MSPFFPLHVRCRAVVRLAAGTLAVMSMLPVQALAQGWSFSWSDSSGSSTNSFASVAACENARAQYIRARRGLNMNYQAGPCRSAASGSYAGAGSDAGAMLGQAVANLLFSLLNKPKKTPEQRALKDVNKALKAQEKGDWEKAAAYYRMALGDFDAPLIHVSLGIALINAGNNADALLACQPVRPRGSDAETILVRSMALHCTGMALYRIGRYGDAESAFRTLFDDLFYSRASGPEIQQIKAYAGYFRGLNAAKAGLYDDAIRYFSDVIAIDPNNDDAVLGLVLAAEDGGREDVLEGGLKRLTVLRSNESIAFKHLARLTQNQGRLAEAENWYRGALQIEPDDEVVLSTLSHMLRRQKRYEEAEKFALRAYEINPDDDRNASTVGQVLYDQGKYLEASRYIEQAVRLAPDNAAHKSFLAYALDDGGDLARAEEAYRAALRQDPGNGTLQASFAFMLMRQGRNREAERLFRQALELRPDSPGYHHGLSQIYENDGRLDAALTEARRALVLDPENEKWKTRVAALEAKTGAEPLDVSAIAARADAQSTSAQSASTQPTAAATPAVTVPAGATALDQASAAAAIGDDATKAEAAQVFDTPGASADVVDVRDVAPLIESDAEYQRIQARLQNLASVRKGLLADLEQAKADRAAGRMSPEDYDEKVKAIVKDIGNLDGIVAREKLKEEERIRYYQALKGVSDTSVPAETATSNAAPPPGLVDDPEYQRIQTRLDGLASVRKDLVEKRADLDRRLQAGEITEPEWRAGTGTIDQDLRNLDGVVARERIKEAERRKFYESLNQ